LQHRFRFVTCNQLLLLFDGIKAKQLITSPPTGAVAKIYDEYVCLSVCLCVLSSVHEDTSRTTCTIFIKFFCACCLCPGLVLWHIDDRLHRLSLGRGDGSAQRGRSVIYDCLVFRLLNACCQFVSSSVSSPHADSMNNVLVG